MLQYRKKKKNVETPTQNCNDRLLGVCTVFSAVLSFQEELDFVQSDCKDSSVVRTAWRKRAGQDKLEQCQCNPLCLRPERGTMLVTPPFIQSFWKEKREYDNRITSSRDAGLTVYWLALLKKLPVAFHPTATLSKDDIKMTAVVLPGWKNHFTWSGALA